MDYKDYTRILHRAGGEVSVFEISEQDDASTVQYFGYLNSEGYWIIQKYDTGASPKTFRYCGGQSAYTTAWANRAILSYVTYDQITT